MRKQTIDKLVTGKFRTILRKANEDAEVHFLSNEVKQIGEKTLFETIEFLDERETEIDDFTKQFLVPSYIDNHSSESWLIKLFSTRETVLNIDDSKLLYEGIFFGSLRDHIRRKLAESRKQIPKFSFTDFISGVEDRFFLELGMQGHVTEEDYCRIRLWQSDTLTAAVTDRCEAILKNFQQTLIPTDDLKSLFQEDIALYRKLMENSNCKSIDVFVSEIKKLSFLVSYKFSDLQFSDQDIELFKGEEIDWSVVTPTRFNSFTTDDEVKRLVFIYSVDRIVSHFEKTISNSEDPDLLINSDLVGTSAQYQDLFYDVEELALEQAEERIRELEGNLDIASLPVVDQKRAYIEILDELREEFYKQKDVFRYYFKAIQREDFAVISFATNCFFSCDPNRHSDQLQKAIISKQLMLHFICELGNLTEGRVRLDEEPGSTIEVMYLMHNMVLESDHYWRLNEIQHGFMKDFEVYGVPFEISIRNMNVEFRKLFFECIDRLSKYLENSDDRAKVLYVQSRLKELRLREFELKQSGPEDLYFKPVYSALFKEFLEIEANFIQATNEVFNSNVSMLPNFQITAYSNQGNMLFVENAKFLQDFPDPQRSFVSALEKRSLQIYQRNLLDDLRLSLELLLKAILKNSRSLENQISALGQLQKIKGSSSELANMFNKLLDYYSKYQNNRVKHNDLINVEEVDIILELTTTFMKYVIALNGKR
jgi:hypothetical protein